MVEFLNPSGNTTALDYVTYWCVPFYLYLIQFSSLPPAPGLHYRPHCPLLPRLILELSSCPLLHPHLHGVLLPPGHRPYPYQHLQPLSGFICSLGHQSSMFQHLRKNARLTPLSPPCTYCMFLSPRCPLLVSREVSSRVSLSCVSGTSWHHYASLLHPSSS